jgi:hypothetical protein
MSSIKLTLAVIFLFLLGACDPGSTIKYSIENKTGESLVVDYEFVYNKDGQTTKKEIVIPADSSKIIHIDYPLGYVGQYHSRENDLSLYYIKLKMGNRVSTKEFKHKDSWLFEKEDDLHATYKLVADSNLFKN